MVKVVWMVIICIVPGMDGILQEAWRIEQAVSLKHCLTMNRVISGAGLAAAFIVRCDFP